MPNKEVEAVHTPSGEVLDLPLLLKSLVAVKKGSFQTRLPIDGTGVVGKIYDTLNDIIDTADRMTAEIERVSVQVGKEGRVQQRMRLDGASGGWGVCVDSVNTLITDVVQPWTDAARVISAVAKGDLSQSMTLEVDGRPITGEFRRTAITTNAMVQQLGTFAAEVTRVAGEVGTDGNLGGQAAVPGAAGVWRELTDNVNSMAANLTGQVRNIATVTTAVANGDLTRKITVDARGEILELKNTINRMVDQLNAFAAEVTRVAGMGITSCQCDNNDPANSSAPIIPAMSQTGHLTSSFFHTLRPRPVAKRVQV